MADMPSEPSIPLFAETVAAGFPSPATDYCESRLDLNELCVKHPAATYFVRAQGDSMTEAGIYPDDVLVVDRSLTAGHGDVVIVALNGELTVKKLETKPVLQLLFPDLSLSQRDMFPLFQQEVLNISGTG